MTVYNPYKHVEKYDGDFSFDVVYQHPRTQIADSDHSGSRKRIGIIGAGAAGLASAYELMKLRHSVTIFEADNRAGGRIRTKKYPDGSHADLGAMRVPFNHHCTRHYIEEFGLKTRPFVNYNANAYYYLRGKKTRLDSFSTLLNSFVLNIKENQNPILLYQSIMQELMATLSPPEKFEMFANKLSSPILKQYNAISFWQYLREHLSPDAFEFIGHATGMIQYERAALLEVLIDFFGLFRVDQFQLVGGMESLVNAFVDKLPKVIEYSAKVNSIEMRNNGVRLCWNRFGQQKVDEFDYVICTVPAPALARIDFEPPLPSAKAQAIRGINYASSAKTLLHTKERPWEFNEGIYGGGSFTDLPIQQIWYPNDNAQPVDKHNTFNAFTGGDQEEYSQAPRSWVAKNPEISYTPSVLTGSYLWENNARRFMALSQQERNDLVLKNLNKIHPEISEYVDDIVHWSWDEQSNPGMGAFAYFAPGEHQRYQEPLCQPYPLDNPRVFFAGEHLAIAHAWIQGAIQTGLVATMNVLQAPMSTETTLELITQ